MTTRRRASATRVGRRGRGASGAATFFVGPELVHASWSETNRHAGRLVRWRARWRVSAARRPNCNLNGHGGVIGAVLVAGLPRCNKNKTVAEVKEKPSRTPIRLTKRTKRAYPRSC